MRMSDCCQNVKNYIDDASCSLCDRFILCKHFSNFFSRLHLETDENFDYGPSSEDEADPWGLYAFDEYAYLEEYDQAIGEDWDPDKDECEDYCSYELERYFGTYGD